MMLTSKPAPAGPARARIADRPRQRTDLQARGLDGETLVLDRAGGLIHQLNETATFVWFRCTGDRSLGEIAQDLADAFDVAPEIAARDVETTVAQLQALRLVDAAGGALESSTAA
jgi:hypothetical protein